MKMRPRYTPSKSVKLMLFGMAVFYVVLTYVFLMP